MAPIPIKSISNYGYADWLHVIHPDTEGSSHAPADHIEHARSIGVTPTNACRDKFLHDRATICVHNSGAGNFAKRNVEKRLTFTHSWNEWWAHHWHEFKEFFHHSDSKGHINSKRGAGDVVNGNATTPVVEGDKKPKENRFKAWIKKVYHQMLKYVYDPAESIHVNLFQRDTGLENGNTSTPVVEAGKYPKKNHFGEWIKNTYHKFMDWMQSSDHGSVAVDWKREKGVEVTQSVEAPQPTTRDPSKNSEFAHIVLHDMSLQTTNLTHPVSLLNGTSMAKSGNATHHSTFSGFHFVEAQAVDGIIPVGIPNYAFAFRDSELDIIVAHFFAGVFVAFGIKWALEALRGGRKRY